MALILPVNGITPTIHSSARIAQNATITGDVSIGEESSIWFQVVIRGDVNKIIIGDRVNIQDGSVVHGTTGRGDTILGNDVSIGHRAIVHGCVIEGRALIGMGAIILDEAIIKPNVIVAAGALVVSGTVCESGWIYAGSPARKLKEISDDKISYYIDGTAAVYTHYSTYYWGNGNGGDL